MKKAVLFIMTMLVLSVILSSCTLFSNSMDKKSGFTKNLDGVETNIRNENWGEALSGQEKAFKSWRQLKPLLQIDIDHDYVNLIEDYFVRLKAYIETQDKSEALATVMLIKNAWENIGIM